MENEKPKLISVGELFAQTWKMYTTNFKKLAPTILFALIGYIPLVFIIALFGLDFGGGPIDAAVKIVLGFLGILSIVFAIYWYTSSVIGVFSLLKDSNKKIKEAFSFGRTFFWRYFAVGILSGVLIMLWSFLFIIPGIIFGIFYSFAVYALLFEDFRGMTALKRSKELVSGYWWPVFWRNLVLIIVVFILTLIINLIFTLPLLFIAKEGLTYPVLAGISSVVRIAFSMFFIALVSIIYSYIIYQNLVKIKPESKVDRTKSGNGCLIVAIVILVIFIPFMATLTIVALNNARMKARDAVRIADTKLIKTALELYMNDNGSCPSKLADLEQRYLLGRTYVDPVSKADYEYVLNGEQNCQVCFNLEEPWDGYPAGKSCLQAQVDLSGNGSVNNTSASSTDNVFTK